MLNACLRVVVVVVVAASADVVIFCWLDFFHSTFRCFRSFLFACELFGSRFIYYILFQRAKDVLGVVLVTALRHSSIHNAIQCLEKLIWLWFCSVCNIFLLLFLFDFRLVDRALVNVLRIWTYFSLTLHFFFIISTRRRDSFPYFFFRVLGARFSLESLTIHVHKYTFVHNDGDVVLGFDGELNTAREKKKNVASKRNVLWDTYTSI